MKIEVRYETSVHRGIFALRNLYVLFNFPNWRRYIVSVLRTFGGNLLIFTAKTLISSYRKPSRTINVITLTRFATIALE